MSSSRTTLCPICGDPYKTYSHYAGDQSACRKCVSKAEGRMTGRKGRNAELRLLKALTAKRHTIPTPKGYFNGKPHSFITE